MHDYDLGDNRDRWVDLDRPTRDELPDALDAPRPARTVRIDGWTYPAYPCRGAGCDSSVRRDGDMCEHCQDLYNAQR